MNVNNFQSVLPFQWSQLILATKTMIININYCLHSILAFAYVNLFSIITLSVINKCDINEAFRTNSKIKIKQNF